MLTSDSCENSNQSIQIQSSIILCTVTLSISCPILYHRSDPLSHLSYNCQCLIHPIYKYMVTLSYLSDNNTSCKCLVRDQGSEKHVSIHRHGSEEIPDVHVIGRRRQMQGSVAETRILPHSVHWNEGSDHKNTSCKCFGEDSWVRKACYNP